MREKLNNNPLAQVAVIAVLLIGGAFVFMSTMGKGGEEESGSSSAASTTSTTATSTATSESPTSESSTSGGAGSAASLASVLPLTGASTADAPPPPRPVLNAWKANKTLVLLFVHDGGINDRVVTAAVDRLRPMSNVATFVVPVHQIARYAAISEGVGVNRVPALVVVSPKRLDHSAATASVLYGYQSPESVVQAVIDAEYKGRTLDYHP